MKNGIDFIYEYSDLNLFQTRAKVLTGKFQGLVVEFGSSAISSSQGKHHFSFDWTVYGLPQNTSVKKQTFEKFLSKLLIAIIDHRHTDDESGNKIQEAARPLGVQTSSIKIDDSFYPYGKASKYCKELA
jgi:hypothetical protein